MVSRVHRFFIAAILVLGRWQRGHILGKGAFGTVYLGLNQDTGELMAIKQIDKSEMSPKELADMEGEVKMVEGLSHENIVR